MRIIDWSSDVCSSDLLAASADYKHSYPHSWRSTAKVIYRCTPQWFVPKDKVMKHIEPKTTREERRANEGREPNPAAEGLCYPPTLRQGAMPVHAGKRHLHHYGRNSQGTLVQNSPARR